MNKQDAYKEISDIFLLVVNHADRYWLDGRFMRWGIIEKDIRNVIDRLACDAAVQTAVSGGCDERR